MKHGFTFTRMLYVKDEVVFSLVRSLTEEQDFKKVLFWFSELYYSGFIAEVWDTIFLVYYMFYANTHSRFERILYKKWNAYIAAKDVVVGCNDVSLGRRVAVGMKERILIGLLKSLHCMKWNEDYSVLRFAREFVHSMGQVKDYRGLSAKKYRGRKPKWFTEAGFDVEYYKEIRSIQEKDAASITSWIVRGDERALDVFCELFKVRHNVKMKYVKVIKSCLGGGDGGGDGVLMSNMIVYKYFHLLWATFENEGGIYAKGKVAKHRCVFILPSEVDIEYVCCVDCFEGNRIYKYIGDRRIGVVNVDWMRDIAGFTLTRDFDIRGGSLKSAVYYDWLWYAYKCPLWRKRIDKFGGVLCKTRTRVVFANDDNHDEFYDTFGIEPDEQTRERLVGAYGSELFG